jgi:xanthine dehydrogenase YagS FAD-binding subunit
LPEVEKLLAGQRITPALAAKAGEAAVAGARPLAKNGYKVPLTRAMVARTLTDVAGRGVLAAALEDDDHHSEHGSEL